jgi:hypothetical protein
MTRSRARRRFSIVPKGARAKFSQSTADTWRCTAMNDDTASRRTHASSGTHVCHCDYPPPVRESLRNARRAGLTRRAFLSSGATAVGLVVAGCAGPAAAPARRLQLTLAPPTGSYSIGTVALHLVDHSRRDPWLAVDRPRELMVSVWYPAQLAGSYPWAPWMPAAAGALFLTQLIPGPPVVRADNTPSPTPSVALGGVRLPVTRARLGAPVDLSARPCPVVLYSPGEGDVRELGTGLVSDLASRGYVVVTIDNTYEAAEVEFPDGRVEVSRQTTLADLGKMATVRVADTQFVLDELATLNSGINPDAEHHPLPAGLAGVLDLSATGMFGHSLGGSTAAATMAADPRISAGINLDGSIVSADMPPNTTSLGAIASLAGPVARRIGDRPFMMMSSDHHDLADDPTWGGFWPDLSGWRLLLSLKDSRHYSYTDEEEFLSQLVTAGIISPGADRQVVIPAIGTIDPGSAVAAERAYIGAFFDLQLRHRSGSLLARPSPSYPQVQFLAT